MPDPLRWRVAVISAVLMAVALRAMSAAPNGNEPIAPSMGAGRFQFTPSISIHARDGVVLSSDLYLPEGSGPFPAIVIRTPYNKNYFRENFQRPAHAGRRSDYLTALFYASHGYAVIVQDFRGRWESGGQFEAFRGRSDFADTAAWIDAQPWSAHRLGMAGCSYVGESQVMAAASNTPTLKAITPMAQAGGFGSALNRYTNTYYYTGGARELGASIPWYLGDGSHLFMKPDPELPAETWARFMPLMSATPKTPADFDLQGTYRSLPLLGMTDRANLPPNDWNLIAAHEAGDAYFTRDSDLIRTGEKLYSPALWFITWNDANPGETLDAFHYAQQHAGNSEAAANQYLVIGPGYHCQMTNWADGMDVGELKALRARFDVWGTILRWNDRWVKGEPNALQSMPRVSYYLMGKDEWRSANDIPLPGTHAMSFYLSSDRGANTLRGDGQLTLKPPRTRGSDHYHYDPAHPVEEPLVAFSSPLIDRRSIEARADVLVYTSAPLTQALTVVGPIKLELMVSSSARDTDFTGNLIDVYPDGRAMSLQSGILRARYRHGMESPELLAPGRSYGLTIDLQAIGNWFAPGHRVRVEVSSSNFPRFDRNLNTGGDNGRDSNFVTAENSVFFGPAAASRLVLPVAPER